MSIIAAELQKKLFIYCVKHYENVHKIQQVQHPLPNFS